jgi:hypothetical protein
VGEIMTGDEALTLSKRYTDKAVQGGGTGGGQATRKKVTRFNVNFGHSQWGVPSNVGLVLTIAYNDSMFPVPPSTALDFVRLLTNSESCVLSATGYLGFNLNGTNIQGTIISMEYSERYGLSYGFVCWPPDAPNIVSGSNGKVFNDNSDAVINYQMLGSI